MVVQCSALVLLFIGLLSGVQNAASATQSTHPSNSNWAGYVIQDPSRANVRGSFGSWTVPSVVCAAEENSVSSEWVGLGGDTSTGKLTIETLYQTGTYSICADGSARYYAFAEDYGSPNIVQSNVTGSYVKPVVLGCRSWQLCSTAISVRPGDAISASVVDHDTYTRWTISDYRDGNEIWTHTKFWLTHAHRHTAECILEDPIQQGTTLTAFPDFQSVSFSHCNASDASGKLWSYSSSSLPTGWKTLRYNVVSDGEDRALASAPSTSGLTILRVPTLGANWPTSGGGYGQFRPTLVSNGGDPTGVVGDITWKSWGGTKAVGTGTSDYVSGDESVAEGSQDSATIVAFNLGSCSGVSAYTEVEWYFPEHGQTFDQSNAINACNYYESVVPRGASTTTTSTISQTPTTTSTTSGASGGVNATILYCFTDQSGFRHADVEVTGETDDYSSYLVTVDFLATDGSVLDVAPAVFTPFTKESYPQLQTVDGLVGNAVGEYSDQPFSCQITSVKYFPDGGGTVDLQGAGPTVPSSGTDPTGQ